MRAVVDANVFLRTARWLAPLEDLARNNYARLFWSPWIIGEAHRVLTWLWTQRAGPPYHTTERWAACSRAAKAFSAHVAPFMAVVEDRPPFEPSWTTTPADEWDVPIWTAAIRANAHVVVTDNVADGPPADAHGVRQYNHVCYLQPDRCLAFMDWLIDDLGSLPMPNLADEHIADATWWVPTLPASGGAAHVHAAVRRFVQTHT